MNLCLTILLSTSQIEKEKANKHLYDVISTSKFGEKLISILRQNRNFIYI